MSALFGFFGVVIVAFTLAWAHLLGWHFAILTIAGVGGVMLIWRAQPTWSKVLGWILGVWVVGFTAIPVSWTLIRAQQPHTTQAGAMRGVLDDLERGTQTYPPALFELERMKGFMEGVEGAMAERTVARANALLEGYREGRVGEAELQLETDQLFNSAGHNQERLLQQKQRLLDLTARAKAHTPPTSPWYERLGGVAPRVLLWTLGAVAIVGIILGIVLKKSQLALASLVGAALVAALFIADAKFFRGGGGVPSLGISGANAATATLRPGQSVSVRIGTEYKEIDVVRNYGFPDDRPVSFHPETNADTTYLRHRGVMYEKKGRHGVFAPPLPPRLAPDPYEVKGNRSQTMTVMTH